MYNGKLIFAQVIDHLPHHTLRRCIQRYHGNHHVKRFSCQDQYRCMAFAQLTYRESLRDIEACLRAQSNKLYHMGLRSTVSRSTLADANEQRDWRIYADFAQSLIHTARHLRERGEDTDMDSYLHLRAGCDHQEAPELRYESLHNSTDFKLDTVRKNATKSTTYQL